MSSSIEVDVASSKTVKININHKFQTQRVKVLVFGHKEFSQLIGTMTALFADSAEFHIIDAIVGSINEVNGHIEKIRPDVIISAGSNAAYLKNNIKIPVVALPVTDADIIAATTKAAKVAHNVKLITYDNHDALVPVLEKALNITIEHHNYATAKLAREQFYLLEANGDSAIVGASLVCDLAVQNGMKSFMYYSAESCRTAIETAISNARTNNQQQLHGSLVDWLVSHENVSFIFVDLIRHDVVYSQGALQQLDAENTTTDELKKDLLAFAAQFNNENFGSHFKRDFVFQGRHYSVDISRGIQPNSLILGFEFDHHHAPRITATKSTRYETKSDLRFESEAMTRVVKKVAAFGQSASNVLITGESGTGKELIARSIHAHSTYANGAFVALNCSAIPTELFEGELFGHTQGAYTGARKSGRKGLIHEAQHGVLFLDEVSELSFEQQAKILRFIQERCYRPVGGNQEIHSDIKIVAATNKPLSDLIEKGTFRNDLFYRLNVLNINIPPLRHRKDDILCIAEEKLTLLLQQNGIDVEAPSILDEINDVLIAYPWPGNVRELENILERLCASLLMTDSGHSASELLLEVAPELTRKTQVESDTLIVAKQLEMVAHAMEMFNGDKQQVADYLGMSQTTLWRRLKKLNQQHKPHSLGDIHAEL